MRRAIGVLLVGLLTVPQGTIAVADDLRVVYGGKEIPARDAARYHCHDGVYPEIRCFETAIERDVDTPAAARASDLAIGSRSANSFTLSDDPTTTTLATFYVTFYQHENYGGSSYTASQSIANLGNIGWNDAISSFKSLNGQRPKWWEHVDWGGGTWQWPAGAWVASVGGSANDRFSAVANVP